MNLEEYRALFLVVTLGLTLLAASPVLCMVAPFQEGSKKFSEFWLLGPSHLVEDYPFNVVAGEMYNVVVGVGNNLHCSEYYLVTVKFRNITQPLPDANSFSPSSLPALYEFRFFVEDKEVGESPVTFGFQDVSVDDDVLSVGDVIINDMVFPVDASTRWNSENSMFYFQLFFELWRYDVDSHSFMFHDQFVYITLNMTAS